MRDLLLPLLVVSAQIGAQATATLPQGFADREGSSYHWAGWNADPLYSPARCTYSYDKSVFPWSGRYEVRQIWLRRDSGVARAFAPHDKRMKIRMSTNGFDPRRPNCDFEQNLGADRTYVLGDDRNYRTVRFSDTEPPASPARFGVQIVLDRPFVVPPDAQNLQVDFIIESCSSTGGTWFCDATHHDAPLDPGRTEVLASTCRGATRTPRVGPVWPGGSAVLQCATGAPREIVVGWLGLRQNPPQTFAQGCSFHVAWIWHRLALASPEPSGAVVFDFGHLPAHEKLVGQKFCFQATVLSETARFDAVHSVSDAIEVTIGCGFPAQVTSSAVYSYGRDLTPTDPDTRFRAAFVSSRALVLGLN